MTGAGARRGSCRDPSARRARPARRATVSAAALPAAAYTASPPAVDLGDQAGVAQHLEVLGHAGPGPLEPHGDLPHRKAGHRSAGRAHRGGWGAQHARSLPAPPPHRGESPGVRPNSGRDALADSGSQVVDVWVSIAPASGARRLHRWLAAFRGVDHRGGQRRAERQAAEMAEDGDVRYRETDDHVECDDGQRRARGQP